jgi:hypothetical protein
MPTIEGLKCQLKAHGFLWTVSTAARKALAWSKVEGKAETSKEAVFRASMQAYKA